MSTTKNPAEKAREKLKEIDEKFKKAEILLCDAQKVLALNEKSFMKKLCDGIKEYILRSNYEGSITIYELFDITGYKTIHEPFRRAINSRLRILREKHKQVHLDYIMAA